MVFNDSKASFSLLWLQTKVVKGSGIENLITSAFCELSGILSGKAWFRAMHGFQVVSTVLLRNVLATGMKTFQDLSEHLAIYRQHPTGKHWVDNLIKPTLLVLHHVARGRDIFCCNNSHLSAWSPLQAPITIHITSRSISLICVTCHQKPRLNLFHGPLCVIIKKVTGME